MVYHAITRAHNTCVIRIVLTITLGLGYLPLGQSQASATPPNCAASRCVFLPVVLNGYPPPLQVTRLAFGQDRTGSFGFFGTVETTTTTPVYDVRVKARLYDNANTLLATKIFSTTFFATLPDQPNPIEGSFFGVPFQTVVSTVVSIDSWTLQSVDTYISQTVTFSPPLTQNGSIGAIFNRGLSTIASTTIAISTGCGVYAQLIPGPIAPGETLTFTRIGCPYDHPPVSQTPMLIGAQSKLAP